MAIGGVVIQFRADADQAKRDVGQLTTKLKDVGDESNRSAGKMGRMSGMLKAGLAGGALAAAGAIGGAAKALIDFGIEAQADAQAAGRLRDTLDSLPGVTQAMIDSNADWIDGMELATHISDDKLRAAMGRLATATGNVTEAQKLLALAADVSVGRNISLEKATKLVEDAHNGNTTALKRQMPWLDANKDGTITYAEAVKGLGDKYEGAAEKAANRDPWEKLKVIWGQLKESLGQWLLPLLKEFGDWFADKDNRAKLQEYINRVAALSEEIGKWLVKAIQDFFVWAKSKEGKAAIKDLSDLIKDMGTFARAAFSAFETLNGYSFIWDLSTLGKLAESLAAIKRAADAAKAAIDRLTGKGKITGGGGGSWSLPIPGETRGARAAAAAAPAANILVTEEMLYRAVTRLLVSGQARNNGRVLVA